MDEREKDDMLTFQEICFHARGGQGAVSAATLTGAVRDVMNKLRGRRLVEHLSQTTESDGIWLGGDAVGKSKLAATAVGSGHQAALSIMTHLKGESFVFGAHKATQITFRQMPFHYYPEQPRHKGEISEQRLDGFNEVVKGLADDDAAHEAKHCLTCDVCFRCDNCRHFCPSDQNNSGL